MPLYFAYGSNLDIDQMRKRCPDSKPLEIGYLKDYRLDFIRFSRRWGGGVADVILDPNQEVWGLIYDVSDNDLRLLDRCEGYPHAYTRFQTSIKTLTNNIDGVWIYTVVQKKNWIAPSKEYVALIKKASEKLNFPKTYLSYLEALEKRNK